MTGRLLGKTRQRADNAGRVIVPTDFRDAFAGGGVVAKDFHGSCLVVYTIPAWEAIEQRYFVGSPLHIEEGKRARRYLAEASYFERLDSHGRILLPTDLRDFAKIETDVVLVGQIDHMEIWSVECYARYWAADADGALLRNDAAMLA
jgi:MraZ protein